MQVHGRQLHAKTDIVSKMTVVFKYKGELPQFIELTHRRSLFLSQSEVSVNTR